MSLGLDYQIKDGVISVIKVDAGGPADKVGIKPGMQALIDCEVCARMPVSVLCSCLSCVITIMFFQILGDKILEVDGLTTEGGQV